MHVRNLPKVAWVLIIIFLFEIGAAARFLLGRPSKVTFSNSDDKYRSYSNALDAADMSGLSPVVRDREERARMRAWEEQVRRREPEIAKKLGEQGAEKRRGPTSTDS